MWVLKLGGSLFGSPRLDEWLAVVATRGGGRVVVVPGGGPFADQVRAAQRARGFADGVAHRMALLAMAQYGLMLTGLRAGLVGAASAQAMRGALAAGRVPVWLPDPEALALHPEIEPSWRTTSDSLALWLAGRLGAARAVLVKCLDAPPPDATAGALARRGVVDPAFAAHLARGACEARIALASEAARFGDALEPGRDFGTPVTRDTLDP